jgi:MFS family permease
LLLLCAVSVLAAFFVQDAVTAVLTISFGVFCAGFAGPCSYAVTIDMGGKDVALVFSMMNMVGNLGAGLIPSMLSLLGGDSWNAVLLLFVLLYLLAALCWLLLKPSGSVLEQSLLAHPEKESE